MFDLVLKNHDLSQKIKIFFLISVLHFFSSCSSITNIKSGSYKKIDGQWVFVSNCYGLACGKKLMQSHNIKLTRSSVYKKNLDKSLYKKRIIDPLNWSIFKNHMNDDHFSQNTSHHTQIKRDLSSYTLRPHPKHHRQASFESIRRVSAKVPRHLQGIKFHWPVPSEKKINSSFGIRWGRAHEGIDIAAVPGSHIVAVDDGVVIYSGKELGGYGNIIILKHTKGLFSVYAHNSRNFVRIGQAVRRAQVIAQVGSTGKSSGPHLHFEVRYKGQALDPQAFLE